MSKPIEFYYDLISPYAYFAATRIDALCSSYGRQVDWIPVNLRTVAVAAGLTKSIGEMPVKGNYVARDIDRMSRYFGVAPWNPFRGGSLNSSPGNRATMWIKSQDPEKAKQFALRLFRYNFNEATDVGDRELLANEAEKLGFDPAGLTAALEDDGLRDAYKANTQDAIRKGMFGAPYFIVDGEPIWGSDRLWMVEAWIKDGGW